MELELSRVDYTFVGVTSTNCLKVLPFTSSQEPQKVAVADNDGVLQVFSIKKEAVRLHFKTLPGPKITSVQLGGATGTPADKIFVAAENEVKAYTKKGKLFLTFDTNMTEPIASMFVLATDLFLCGKHVYNHYRDCKDVGSYLCGDSIVDVVAFQKAHRLITLVACEGRMLRGLEHGRVTMTVELDSAPTVLHVYELEKIKYVLFGTVDGRLGLLDMETTQSFDRWLVDNKKYASAIVCVHSYDMTGDGSKNLIVGRQDGNVEVYVVNLEDALDCATLIYVHNCNESVTALQCGKVGNQGYEEILVATYTGRIFGLTSEPIDKSAGGDTKVGGNYIFTSETSGKITKLKSDVEELKQKVTKERERYQSSTQSFGEISSAIPLLTVKFSMLLSKLDSSYTLTLEVPTPLDNVLLQSEVPIDLLDVEKNSAVVSHSESNPRDDGNFLLATYRCQINTNRLELKIRTIEGQYGVLRAYVTPLMQPKCCRVVQYRVKPLSQHVRVYGFERDRPLNTLSLKGAFSLAEVHSWVSLCVPEVPERPEVADRNVLVFQSTFLGTVVVCTYAKAEAVFESDNASTISIIKEFVTEEATRKKIKVDIGTSLCVESVAHTLSLLNPKLQSQRSLSKKIQFLDALEELEVTDEMINYLSPKYKDLLNCEKELREEFARLPSHLDRIYGVVTDLYVDYYKLKGVNVKAKIPKLVEILEAYTYENLLEFFMNS